MSGGARYKIKSHRRGAKSAEEENFKRKNIFANFAPLR